MTFLKRTVASGIQVSDHQALSWAKNLLLWVIFKLMLISVQIYGQRLRKINLHIPAALHVSKSKFQVIWYGVNLASIYKQHSLK